MVITRNGNAFVLDADRTAEPASTPLDKLRQRLHEFRELYASTNEHLALYTDHGAINAVFSTEPGYALAECVKNTYSDHYSLIWVNDLKDGKLLVVVVTEGMIRGDSVIDSDNDTFWTTVISPDCDYFVICDGSLPEKISVILGEDNPSRFEHVDYDLCSKIQINEEYRLLPTREAYEYYKKRIKGKNSNLFIAIGAVIIVGVLFYNFSEDSEVDEVIIDPFEGYRNLYQMPSASSVLADVYRSTLAMTTIYDWQLINCKFDSYNLSCQFSHNPGSRNQSLETLSHVLNKNVSITVDGEYTTVSTAIEGATPTVDIITPLKQPLLDLKESLTTKFLVDNFITGEMYSELRWGNVSVDISKTNTRLPTLLHISETLIGSPTRLETAQIDFDMATAGVSINAKIKVIGLN